MRKIFNKGHRIRASDKHLVYHFSIGTLLFVFVAVLLLLNIKQLMRTDWEHFSLLENGLTLSTYNFITILIATGVCALVALLYYRFCYDSFKKLLHRQKLARMILENKWYEADTVQDSVFFTDLQSRSREKIVWFPKIYYQMEKGLLHIRCEITLGKYQDQLLRLEDKLESGLYCELTDKTLHDGYIEYTLLYDMIANPITIDEVRAENGCLRLMKNLVWEYDALPHALIAGGTGGGKTYFLLTLIEALLHTNAVLYILDPKNADLADLGTVMGNVYHTKEEMIDCVNAAVIVQFHLKERSNGFHADALTYDIISICNVVNKIPFISDQARFPHIVCPCCFPFQRFYIVFHGKFFCGRNMTGGGECDPKSVEAEFICIYDLRNCRIEDLAFQIGCNVGDRKISLVFILTVD